MASQRLGEVPSAVEQATLESDVIGSRLRMIRALPPRAIAGRVAFTVAHRLNAARERRRDVASGSFAEDGPGAAPRPICDAVPQSRVERQETWIRRAAPLYMDHRFDLLGSGWVHVAHGVRCEGNGGILYDAAPAVAADGDGQWLARRINRANLQESQRIWRMVDLGYIPIDWQLDFKSGFRWSEGDWSGDISFGVLDGVDVKVPWELARMQHLVVLAWAQRLGGSGERVVSPYAREFRNQVLDFIATNPPRFGVNWRCTMDVAIRAANWVVAYGLFRAHGATFDREFESVLARSLLEHGRHIASHLEVYPEGRANHYLADVAGLLFVAACLPPTEQTDAWLAFAAHEVLGETLYQFNPDGSNFEGSTCYHRLSLEFVSYAAAVIAGLPEERTRRLRAGSAASFRTRPRRPPARGWQEPGPAHMGLLERGASFIAHTSRPDGRIVQIGDNDSGRFLKPHPVFRETGPSPQAYLKEDHLDCRGVIAAVRALSRLRADDSDRLDGALARALAGGRQIAGDGDIDRAARVRVGNPDELLDGADHGGAVVELVVPGGQLRDRLLLFGYPDFGIWIFRSRRLHLAVRCGPSSSPRAGGSHAHNDQLAIDLTIDGEPWVTDPGTYLYCPPLETRNRWRSVTAHAAPQWPGREPARLDIGTFRLRDETRARCLYFGERGFAGEHVGYGRPVRRAIALGDESITITDIGLPGPAPPGPVRCDTKEAVGRHFALAVPTSPAYGEIELSRTEADSRMCHEHPHRHP